MQAHEGRGRVGEMTGYDTISGVFWSPELATDCFIRLSGATCIMF
jgi:hypothetical protein